MDKTKAKTLVERFGFKDTELTTPEHDDIFCWLFNKMNICKMLTALNIISGPNELQLDKMSYSDINKAQCDWSIYTDNCTGNCYNGDEQTKASIVSSAKNNFNICNRSIAQSLIQAINIYGEFAVLSGTYNIGFIDAKITIDTKAKPTGQEKKHCTFYLDISNLTQVFYIEIKPKVQSLGELLRQINLYRSHIDYGKWIILTDEIKDEFETILKDQNIYVYNRTKYFDKQLAAKPVNESFFDRKGS